MTIKDSMTDLMYCLMSRVRCTLPLTKPILQGCLFEEGVWFYRLAQNFRWLAKLLFDKTTSVKLRLNLVVSIATVATEDQPPISPVVTKSSLSQQWVSASAMDDSAHQL